MRLMPNSFTKKLLALTLAGFGTASCSLLEDYPQNPHIQETSSESYKNGDELASDILQISYDNAGENGGRFTNFITRSKEGAQFHQLNDERESLSYQTTSQLLQPFMAQAYGMIAISVFNKHQKIGKTTEDSLVRMFCRKAMIQKDPPNKGKPCL